MMVPLWGSRLCCAITNEALNLPLEGQFQGPPLKGAVSGLLPGG